MKHKAQEALNDLYDEAACEREVDEDTGELVLFDCTNHDKYLNMREPLQKLINNQIPYEIICKRIGELEMEICAAKYCGFSQADIDIMQTELSYLLKQKEMWEEE